jgi:cytosine/adenosine deaminase-related metal-dependent hydrolase
VTCSLSSNNILNPATPYGDCSLIRIANLHANILQVIGAPRLRELFLMLSEHSARLLRLADYGLEIGKPADIAIIDATSAEQAVAEISPAARGVEARPTHRDAPAAGAACPLITPAAGTPARASSAGSPRSRSPR